MDLAEITRHVKTLKTLILRSRYVAARQANAEMLKLYFSIGAYVSEHSRKGKWGTSVIEDISEQLSRELPGLRGFSARNIRYMRDFFEGWMSQPILQPVVAKLGNGQNEGCRPVDGETWQPMAAKLGKSDLGAFLSIGFTHHMIIIAKCKTVEERLFYIRRCAAGFWSKEALKRHLAANEYATEGHAVNNFALTIPDDKQVGRAVQAFRSEYLLDFVNIVDLNETEQERDEPLKRDFYMEMCAVEHWSTRTLQGRIRSMMYERTAIAKKPETVIKKDIAALRDEVERPIRLLSLRGVLEFWRNAS